MLLLLIPLLLTVSTALASPSVLVYTEGSAKKIGTGTLLCSTVVLTSRAAVPLDVKRVVVSTCPRFQDCFEKMREGTFSNVSDRYQHVVRAGQGIVLLVLDEALPFDAASVNLVDARPFDSKAPMLLGYGGEGNKRRWLRAIRGKFSPVAGDEGAPLGLQVGNVFHVASILTELAGEGPRFAPVLEAKETIEAVTKDFCKIIPKERHLSPEELRRLPKKIDATVGYLKKLGSPAGIAAARCLSPYRDRMFNFAGRSEAGKSRPGELDELLTSIDRCTRDNGITVPADVGGGFAGPAGGGGGGGAPPASGHK